MRIIGGFLGGRRLKAPSGAATRPTSDRVREAVFNILGPPPADTRVLDLFAGAGALGLEALSRGASEAWLVDMAPAAVRCVRANVAALDVAERTRVFQGDALDYLRRWDARSARHDDGAAGHFGWIFLDPPYRTDLAARALALLGTGGLLAPDALVVAEHDRRNQPDLRHGCLVRTDRRRYGDTEVSFFRHQP